MAGAVEPLLYSSLKDIGVATLCWRSLTWIQKINHWERNILEPNSRKEMHEWGQPWYWPEVFLSPPPCTFHLFPLTWDFQTRIFLSALARIPEFDVRWPHLGNKEIPLKFSSFHFKLKLLHPGPSGLRTGLSSTPLTISNQSLSDQQLPCIFLRWNLGLPRKLFLIELSLDLQWTAEGEPGGVGSSCSVSPPAGIPIFKFSQHLWFEIDF